MERMTVNAAVRTEMGKSAAKAIRATGRLPAVMYNSKGESTMLTVDEAEFTKVWKQATPTTLINLVVDGTTHIAFIKTTEYNIIADRNLHVDFHVIDADKPLVAAVKLIITGNAAGVREGGVFFKGNPNIKIKCLPENLPVRIFADVNSLKIGDSLKVKDIPMAEGVEVVSNGEAVVASVRAPKR